MISRSRSRAPVRATQRAVPSELTLAAPGWRTAFAVTLAASPRQQTSEMLSAAPGFFVDHEDGEGLGNDVYLRGFNLDHGSGIEMRVGSIPINSPLHIQGQGYADANFIIPEAVQRAVDG